MATIDIENEIDLDEPTCIEGLPGVGLVGKIAADQIIDTFDMTYYAAIRCSGLRFNPELGFCPAVTSLIQS